MIMNGSREGSRVSNHSISPEAAQVNEVSGNRRRKDSIMRKGSRNRKRFIVGAPGGFLNYMRGSGDECGRKCMGTGQGQLPPRRPVREPPN